MSDALDTLTPMCADEIMHAMADATEKMKDYCRYRSVQEIISAYNRYKRFFGLLKKPPLLEWCEQDYDSGWFASKNSRHYAFTWTYENTIEKFITSAKYSKTKIVYLSGSALQDFKSIIYRTTNKELLEEINKCKEENKELWDYLVKRKIV